MKLKHFLVAATLASAAPALAQTAPASVTAGATVYGPDGNEVGTVDKVSGTTAIVNTGKHSAALPTSAFGKNDKGLLVSMSKDQLDAAVEAAEAKASGALDTALVAGATVHSSDGQPMGTVKAISPEGVVTIDNAGSVFSLKKDAFTTDAQGLALRATKAAVDEAVAKQAPAPAAK